MKYRRFGRTDFNIPVITCGGMRYQQSWKGNDPVPDESQRNLENCIHRALELGINHIETARAYGTSEYQLGKVLPTLPRDKFYMQTKVGPAEDTDKFKYAFEKSLSLLNLDYIDIFSFHGINDDQSLEYALNCCDKHVFQWKKEGRVRDIGFSTHADYRDINKALKTGVFDHINLHWYYINQENLPAIEEAKRQDAGVFIISPNDKGGRLYDPSEKLVELCAPLHPMVFNGLFCLSNPDVHTLSCGAARPEDFDIHVEMVEMLDQVDEILPPIIKRLEDAMAEALGEKWAQRWDEDLPRWDENPGEINMHVALRMRNLAVAYDMIEYAKNRYNMLGSGGAFFPGQKPADFDEQIIAELVKDSPLADQIPGALAEAHALLNGEQGKRLAQD
jgi:hypothetical protein